MSSRIVALDYETYYEKPTQKSSGYSVATLGNWRYTHDPRFEPYLLSVYDGEESWVGPPGQLNRAALDGATLLSHNAAFDRAVDARAVELGLIAPIHPVAWHCTANLSSYLCNRRSLAEASEYLLRVKVDKTMRDWMNRQHWADAEKHGQAQKLMNYARLDVTHCWNLWNKFSSFWTPLERDLSELTIRQCGRGVAIDRVKLEQYTLCVGLVLLYLKERLPWVVNDPDTPVTSPNAIARECHKVGIPRPPVKAHDGGEEAFAEWEATYGPQFFWIAAVGQWRSLNKILTTLKTIKERLQPDGTIDFSLLYFGAHTGRWSGGGSSFNLQNLRKSIYYVRDDYSVSEVPEPGVIYRTTLDLRSLLVPRSGRKFVICDLAQIEPRVLRWLTSDTNFLELVSKGMSPYEAAARISPSIQWTGGDLKKENRDLYQRVKINELGLGYGCGAVKFHGLAKEGGLDITPEQAKAEVDQWRTSNPRICALWRLLDDQFKECVGQNFEVELPSGRTLRYARVRRAWLPFKKKEGEKIVVEFKTVYTADVGGRRKPLYGGLLTENLVQATARDVFAGHLLALDRAGINTVFHVHDEAVTEVPLDTDPRDIERIMSITPEWLPGAPIAAEATEAEFYGKG